MDVDGRDEHNTRKVADHGHAAEQARSVRRSESPADLSLADRDYWREVPEYRRLMGCEPDRRPTAARQSGDFWKRPVTPMTGVLAALLGIGVILLPHLTILGRHWHLYFLP